MSNKPYKDYKERTRPMCKNINTARAYNLFDVLAICVYGSNNRRWNNIPEEYPAADGWGDTSDEKTEAYKKCKLRNNIQMVWRLARMYATCPALADNPDLPAFLAYLMRLIFIYVAAEARKGTYGNASPYHMNQRTAKEVKPYLTHPLAILRTEGDAEAAASEAFQLLCWQIASRLLYYSEDDIPPTSAEDMACWNLFHDLWNRTREMMSFTDGDVYCKLNDTL